MTIHPAKFNIGILGIIFLLLGGAVYLLARDPQKLYLAKYLFIPDESATPLIRSFPSWISWLTESLPTAVHAFSFSLFTALIFRLSSFSIAISCIAWAAVDWIFELLQILKPISCISTPDDRGIGGIFCGYISNGVFDWNDMLSILIGSSLAYILLMYSVKRSKYQQ